MTDNTKLKAYQLQRFCNFEQNQNLCKKPILIVDDDHSMLSLMEMTFRNKYEVDVASNGKEALSKLTNSFYDLVDNSIHEY